jgi:hypothetical protein
MNNYDDDDNDELDVWKGVDRESMLAVDSEHRLRSMNLPFDIDVWYPPLKKHTFHSVFIPLTRQQAIACVRL